MWRAWVGFNATHSLGLILFGALYGYLATRHSAWLFSLGSCLPLASHFCLAMQSSRSSIFSLHRFATLC